VKLLINGTSVAQVQRDRVTYFHVELPRHAIILAEDLPVESYLDVGDRTNFHATNGTIRLFPDFATQPQPDAARVWETCGAAPLVTTGPLLAAMQRLMHKTGYTTRGRPRPMRDAGCATRGDGWYIAPQFDRDGRRVPRPVISGHIGGTRPSFPTSTRLADSVPSLASVPVTITCAPATSSAGEPGTNVTTGVSGGTTMIFSPS
jgi:hypothetical protein